MSLSSTLLENFDSPGEFSRAVYYRNPTHFESIGIQYEFRHLYDDPEFKPNITFYRAKHEPHLSIYTVTIDITGKLLTAEFEGLNSEGRRAHREFYNPEGKERLREFFVDPEPLPLDQIYSSAELQQLGEPKGPLVTVIDTGVDYNHPSLARQVLREREPDGSLRIGFDPRDQDSLSFDLALVDTGSNHGTGVASVIVQYSPEIRIFPVRYSEDSELSEEIDEGYRRGSRIFNLSSSFEDVLDSDSQNMKSSLLKKADQYPDALFVIAAGNSGQNLDQLKIFDDARRPNIIYVASARSNHELFRTAPWEEPIDYEGTCYGERTVDFAHYGVDIRVASPGNLYEVVTGTSYAAPQVSGMAARVLVENPHLKASEVGDILRRSVTEYAAMQGRLLYPGVPNLERALEIARQ